MIVNIENKGILEKVYILQFDQSIYQFIHVNPQFQFTNQINSLSHITHKCRLMKFRTCSLIATNIKIEDRIITNYKFSRLCPVETPEGSHVGIVNSPRLNSRLRIDRRLSGILNCSRNRWFTFKSKRAETKTAIRFQTINHYKSWKKLLTSGFIRTVNIFNQIQF